LGSAKDVILVVKHHAMITYVEDPTHSSSTTLDEISGKVHVLVIPPKVKYH
jgi:hypothetical protein